MPTPLFTGYPVPPAKVQDLDTKIFLDVPDPLEYGTINLAGRRPVKLSMNGKKIVPLAKKEGVDFEYATLSPITLGPMSLDRFPGKKVMVLVPSLDIEKSVVLTDEQALNKFRNDGLHLGIFSNETELITHKNKSRVIFRADVYGKALSEQEKKRTQIFLREDPTLNPNNSRIFDYDTSKILPSDSAFVTEVFSIAGLPRAEQDKLSGRLLSLSVSYSMSLTTEISATYDDRDYALTKGGYFDPRREYKYRGLLFEVVACESSPGSAGYPQASVTFAPKCVQELRRDKKPESITAVNGFEYARQAAARCGMNFVGEMNSRQQTVFKGRNQSTDESVWTVLTETGADGQFFVFEVDNTLVYASATFLMWKFGLSEKENKKKEKLRYLDLRYDPSLVNNGAVVQKVFASRAIGVGEDGAIIYDQYVAFVNDNGIFELATWPTVRVSENDGLEGTGSCSVLSPNGRLIRPGHTIYLTSVPDRFVAGYLVQDVSFTEFTKEPVTLGLVMVQKPKDQKKPDKETD